MSDLVSGMSIFILTGFAALGAGIGYLYLCDRLSKVLPRTATVLSSFVVAVAPALLGGVLATMAFGSHVGLYVLPVAYIFSVIYLAAKAFEKTGKPYKNGAVQGAKPNTADDSALSKIR